MTPSEKLIRSASIGDTILIAEKRDSVTWSVDETKLVVQDVILYGERTIKYTFKDNDETERLTMSISDCDLERIFRSHEQVILLVKIIPEDIMFQCKLSGDYSDAVAFQGFAP